MKWVVKWEIKLDKTQGLKRKHMKTHTGKEDSCKIVNKIDETLMDMITVMRRSQLQAVKLKMKITCLESKETSLSPISIKSSGR